MKSFVPPQEVMLICFDFESLNITGSNISSTDGDLNLTAMLGNLNIKAGESIDMNITGNLLLKSKQNLLESDSYSIGASLGISGGQNAFPKNTPTQNPMSGGINGVSAGFNIGNGFQSRAWVDQLTSIIGTDSVNIDVGTKDDNGNYIEGTGNTNIVGAMIANAVYTNQTPQQVRGETYLSLHLPALSRPSMTGSITSSTKAISLLVHYK